MNLETFKNKPKISSIIRFLEARGVSFKEKKNTWMKYHPDPNFNKRIVTTIDNNIYLPDLNYYSTVNSNLILRTLAHEYVHVKDSQKHKLFKLSYIFPQFLAVFSLLAVFSFLNINFLYCLLFLLFLGKLPSPFRLYWELRGYTMSLAVRYWTETDITEADIDRLAKILNGRTYWMWIPEKFLRNLIKNQVDKIKSGEILNDPVFHEIQIFLITEQFTVSSYEID